jgi:hypothetical protein
VLKIDKTECHRKPLSIWNLYPGGGSQYDTLAPMAASSCSPPAMRISKKCSSRAAALIKVKVEVAANNLDSDPVVISLPVPTWHS